ncbi:MAG: hypothetical protein F6J95_025290 [Leptolyngbya sp. SIO1E4]|nr:hypothetical protein [Leptolyngbya sp. SIO1E4]
MNAKQLELELDLALEDAAEMPVLADLNALWQQAEPVIVQLSVHEQLRLGGKVIDQLAGLHQARAEFLLGDWENTYNPQDPTVPGDWLQGLVRQTQQVDLSELTAPVQRRPPGKASKAKSELDTVVGEVPKANVLKMLDQVEQAEQKAAVLSVAHEESIQAWVAAIAQWFEHHPQPILLLQLQQSLGWPLVKLWLSLLLGGFTLEAVDDRFYSLQILVSDTQSDLG